jgi:hypothetical protein
MKRLLVATDGSEYSSGAIRESINIAKKCASEITALSVIEINPQFMAMAPQIIEATEKDIRGHLEHIKKMVEDAGIGCEIEIREGEDVYKLIIEEADKRDADLIIMGRRGRKGITKLLMGSATARVIGHSHRNVLVVPRASEIKWKSIVVATDGSEYSYAAEKAAVRLIKDCCEACTLGAIAVTRPDATEERIRISERALEDIKATAEKEGIEVDVTLVKNRPHETIHETIIEYARQKEADIVVMGSHGRTGIERLLMGSVCERVIGHIDRAVLVAKISSRS